MPVWTGAGGNAFWTDTGNWDTGVVPNGIGTVAGFDFAVSTLGSARIPAFATITISTLNVRAGGPSGYVIWHADTTPGARLIFNGGGSPALVNVNSPAAADPLRLGNGGTNLAIELATDTIFDVLAQSTTTAIVINAPMSGVGTLIKRGPSLLRIDSSNSFSGGILIEGGTLQTLTDAALGSGQVTISNNALFQALATVDQDFSTLSGQTGTAGAAQIAALNGGTMTLTGTLNHLSQGVLTFGTSGGTGTIIASFAAIGENATNSSYRVSSGTLRIGNAFNAANLFSRPGAGLTEIATGGVLETRGFATVISNLDMDGGTLRSSTGTLNVTVNDVRTGAANVQAGTLEGTSGADLLTINISENFNLAALTLASWTAGIDAITLNGSNGNNSIGGSTGDDSINGFDGDDVITSNGGEDVITGGSGNDTFDFGATLTAADRTDGGSGSDQLGIAGNYTGANALVLDNSTLVDIEVLALLPGAGNGYAVTMNNANVAAGVEMTIFAGNLGAGQNFTFNGSAETDGFFRTFGGLGTDNIIGSQQSDGFYFGPGKWQSGDTVIGGGGTNDQLALDGDYTLTIGSSAIVEVLVLLASPDAGNPNDFNITLSDAWATGAPRTVFGRNNITAMTINGAAESTANLTIFGGRAGDTLTTGGGADTIYGLEGNDAITGGLGSDTAVYQGLRATYSVVTGGGNVQIVDNDAVADGNDGTDTVVGIEFAQFSDQTISITSPIILDLDGGGVETLSASQSAARFDMDGDGVGDDTSWFGRGEGLLFLDRNGDGTLSNAGEMSFTGDVPNARSDLEGLRAFDSNGDGELSRRDARFADFKIWRDRDGDGVVDRREVMTLRQAGVRSLSLTGTANSGTYALGDTAVVNTGSFTRTNGRQGGLIDAVLTAVSSKAETDALAAMRDAMASDVGSTDSDPRLALMTQDMVSFGATPAATETDRWRREGLPQVEMFAA